MSGPASGLYAPLPSLWDDAHAAGLDEPGLLLYRSNLLGADLRITNFGGGNTSAKLFDHDPLTGAPVTVLWVKGSGGDLGSMKLDGFATLYLDKLIGLKRVYRGLKHEDEMVALFNHCVFDLNPRAADYLGIGDTLSATRKASGDAVNITIGTPEGIFGARLVQLGWWKNAVKA